MPVNATIPLTQDFLETAASYPFLTELVQHPTDGYLYGCYHSSALFGSMIRVKADNFADITTVEFANDGQHANPVDMVYVPSTDRFYVLFRNGDANRCVISAVTPSTLARTDFFNFTDIQVGAGSITADATNLYVVTFPTTPSYLVIIPIAAPGTFAEPTPLTGFSQAHCVRQFGGKLFAQGMTPPTTGWVMRLTAAGVVEETATFTGEEGEFPVDEIGESPGHIWVGNRDLLGEIRKYSKTSFINPEVILTTQLSKCTCVKTVGSYVWAAFENGRGVRINPSNVADRRIYTLNAGEGYHSEFTGGNEFVYTYNYFEGKISRYHIPSDVAAGDFVWSQFIFGTPLGSIFGGRAAVLAVKADSNENVIAAGTFSSGEVDFGGTTKTTSGTDIFIAKYNPDKTLMWVKTFTSVVNPQFIYLALDSSDNIFITGAFTGGSLNLGGGVLPYTGLGSFSNIFLGWFSPGSQGVPGTHLFSRSIGSNRGNTRPNGIWVDGAGMVVLAGGAALNTDFGGGTTSGGGFIAKYSSVNVYQWDKVFLANVVALTVDGADQIIILGTGSVNLGGGTISNPNSAWVAKFTAGSLGIPGTHTWSRPVATIGAAFANGVATDGANRAVVVGSFGGTVNFGGGNVSTDQGATAAYVAVFDSSSNYANHLKIGGRSVGGVNGSETAFGVDVDTLNNIAFFGRATGEVSWGDGGTPDVGTGNANAFIAKYDSLLAHQWHTRYSSAANITGNGITADPSRNTIFGGSFIGAFDFGDGNQSSPVTPDGMLLKFGA